MKRSFLWVALLGALISVQSTSAILMLDPYIAALKGGNGDDRSTEEEDYKGLLYGFKLGADLPFLRAGGIFEKSLFKVDAPSANTAYLDQYDGTSYGFFAGFQLGLFHLDFDYFLYSTMEGDEWDGTGVAVVNSRNLFGESEYRDGSGFGFTFGFTLLPYVNLNLYYRSLDYDKVKVKGTTNSTIDTDFEVHYVGFGASFPIDLL